MKRLYLLRHASSSWKDTSLPDHDRPLAGGGRRAANGDRPPPARPGHRAGTRPVLHGTTRARDAQRIEPALATPTVRVEEDLYAASAGALVERLRNVPDTIESVMLIGHNPGLQELAVDLARPSPAVSELATKYPTAALARLALPASSWSELHHDTAELVELMRPAGAQVGRHAMPRPARRASREPKTGAAQCRRGRESSPTARRPSSRRGAPAPVALRAGARVGESASGRGSGRMSASVSTPGTVAPPAGVSAQSAPIVLLPADILAATLRSNFRIDQQSPGPSTTTPPTERRSITSAGGPSRRPGAVLRNGLRRARASCGLPRDHGAQGGRLEPLRPWLAQRDGPWVRGSRAPSAPRGKLRRRLLGTLRAEVRQRKSAPKGARSFASWPPDRGDDRQAS
jgi:phosphohistidine phosphatase